MIGGSFINNKKREAITYLSLMFTLIRNHQIFGIIFSCSL